MERCHELSIVDLATLFLSAQAEFSPVSINGDCSGGFFAFGEAKLLNVASLPDNQSSEKDEERELGLGVPKHVPLKIKTKNIKSKKWAHDLEIEVTNTSNKPIYYLSFMVVMQGIKSPEGKEYMFWVHYGRGQLNDFSTKLENTDIPLMPNESYVLKIDQAQADGWEKTRSKLNKPQPSKVGLVFQMLNFGDGTGYGNAQGRFFDINRKVGLDQKCLSPIQPCCDSGRGE